MTRGWFSLQEWVEYDIEGTRTAGRGLYLFKDGDFEQALVSLRRSSYMFDDWS